MRIHDGVLEPEQIRNNYLSELGEFAPSPCPEEGEEGYADTHLTEAVIEATGSRFGPSHRLIAAGEDDSGDPILYTFTVEPQMEGEAVQVIGPQASGRASIRLRTDGSYHVTITVQDREDCDDFADDAIYRGVIILGDDIPAEDCGNGWDDDADGDTDCDDTDCAGTAGCDAAPAEICDNGVDDDGDGATDCVYTDGPA